MNTRRTLAILLLLAISSLVLAGDYFPLSKGNSWTDDIMYPMPNNTLTKVGTATWNITGDTVYNNQTYFACSVHIKYGSMIDSTLPAYILNQGNDVYLTTNLASATALVKVGQHQYQGNESWTSGVTAVAVSYCATTHSAAGNFDSCYALLSGTDTNSIFAPNVGPLRMLFPFNGITVSLYLTSYTIVSSAVIRNASPNRSGAFTFDNASGAIRFDGQTQGQGALSLYGTNGRLVKEYQIGGIGAIAVSRRDIGSSDVIYKLRLNGKVYTGMLPHVK
jgi:hypothetical protein